MNATSTSMPDAPPVPAAAVLLPTRPLYWSVRRELWENRSIYVAPLVAAGVLLLGFVISMIYLPPGLHTLIPLDPANPGAVMAMRYDVAAVALIFTGVIVGAFYCLDALHSERRDRSILFWKSLPVSDFTTVLSKASIPFVVIPLITFVLVLAVHLAMLLLGTAILPLQGLSPAPLWTRVPVFRESGVLLYGLAVIALWHAPVYAWLLLVSGWARRAILPWAVLPPAALALVERIGFGTSYIGHMIKARLIGGTENAFVMKGPGSPEIMELTPLHFLSTPGLWIGLVVAVVLFAAAVRMRRSREPI